MTRISQKTSDKKSALMSRSCSAMCDEEIWDKSDHRLCVGVLDMLCDEIRGLRETTYQEIEMKDLAAVPKYLTVGQVAEVLQISKMSVTRYIRRGHITALQVGGVYRITEPELLRILGDGIPNAPAPKKSKRRKKNGTTRSGGSKA